MNTELGIKRNDGFISLPAKEAAAGVTSRHRRSPQKGLGVHRAMQDLAGLDRHPVPAEGGPLKTRRSCLQGGAWFQKQKGGGSSAEERRKVTSKSLPQAF